MHKSGAIQLYLLVYIFSISAHFYHRQTVNNSVFVCCIGLFVYWDWFIYLFRLVYLSTAGICVYLNGLFVFLYFQTLFPVTVREIFHLYARFLWAWAELNCHEVSDVWLLCIVFLPCFHDKRGNISLEYSVVFSQNELWINLWGLEGSENLYVHAHVSWGLM